MNANRDKAGIISENSSPVGTVTREMVLARARELAVINGRSPHQVLEGDFSQAARELRGESDLDPKEAALESVPESERWNPVPGTPGHKAPAVLSDDDDEEGRSDQERLIEEGIADAEHDQMLQASRDGTEAEG